MQIQQKPRLTQTDLFTLLDDRLVVRVNSMTGLHEYSVFFHNLSESPRQMRRSGLQTAIASLLCFLASAALIAYAVYDASEQTTTFTVTLLFFLLPLALFLAHRAFQSHFDLLVFDSTIGPVFFRVNRPDPDSFRNFINELLDRVRASRDTEANIARSVLHQLKANEIIDQWTLDRALARFQLDTLPPEPSY